MRAGFHVRLVRRIAANAVRRRLGLSAIPFKLLWNTTYYCNSRCRTCNIWDIYPTNGSQKDELGRAEVAEIVSSLGPHLLWLTMTGGEPTLKLHMADTVCDIYDACANLSFITVNSNAILPEPTVRAMDRIAAHCVRAEVLAVLSLDGVGKVHDDVRGAPGNFESVVETRRRLYELRRTRPNLGVCFQSTVSRHNLDHLEPLLDFCREGGDEHLLTFAQEAELYRNYGAGHDVTADRAVLPRVVQEISRRYRPRRLRDLVQWAHLRLMQRFLDTRHAPVPCTAGSSTITLGPRGDVSGCLFLANPMGNAKDFGHDLGRLLGTDRAREVQRACSTCSQCWTNCESFTSMLGSPLRTLARAITTRPRRPAEGVALSPPIETERPHAPGPP
jgi:MoaA/NifB/PqqE/SkfB family radical SAM enzyme